VSTKFQKAIAAVINSLSVENESNTPDFILASYLNDCLNAWNRATNWRTMWFSPEGVPAEYRENGPPSTLDSSTSAAQRTEPAPAQEQLGRDRTDEWESRMDAQKQAAQAGAQSAGNNSSGAEQINVPQCTAPVQQSVGTDELQRIQMTAALAAARPVIEAERDKQWSAALQDEVEQWPGYESWYKCFTKDVLARLNAHKEERVTVEKEMR
jgi:hypothetical protein